MAGNICCYGCGCEDQTTGDSGCPTRSLTLTPTNNDFDLSGAYVWNVYLHQATPYVPPDGTPSVFSISGPIKRMIAVGEGPYYYFIPPPTFSWAYTTALPNGSWEFFPYVGGGFFGIVDKIFACSSGNLTISWTAISGNAVPVASKLWIYINGSVASSVAVNSGDPAGSTTVAITAGDVITFRTAYFAQTPGLYADPPTVFNQSILDGTGKMWTLHEAIAPRMSDSSVTLTPCSK
jgi:hypothetical protein